MPFNSVVDTKSMSAVSLAKCLSFFDLTFMKGNSLLQTVLNTALNSELWNVYIYGFKQELN